MTIWSDQTEKLDSGLFCDELQLTERVSGVMQDTGGHAVGHQDTDKQTFSLMERLLVGWDEAAKLTGLLRSEAKRFKMILYI